MAEAWSVVAQVPTVGKLPDGTFGDVVRVTFRTAAGNLGVVIVPATTYSAAAAREAIEAHAAELDAVTAL